MDDKVYEVADYIVSNATKQNFISRDEFDRLLAKASEKFDIDYEDLEPDVRTVLSFEGYNTDFENGDLTLGEEAEGEVDEKVSFMEIAERMDSAEDYADLYEAASLIADSDLRLDVENLIEQCEDDEDEISQAVSIVTSDLLDMHIEDKNIAGLTEARKLSPEDEAHFEEENDKLARQEIEDMLNNDKKEPDEEIEKELDNIEETKKVAESDSYSFIIYRETIKAPLYVHEDELVSDKAYASEYVSEEDANEALLDIVENLSDDASKYHIVENIK